jgi:hypothetical protein
MTFCKLRQALGHKAKAGHFELSRFCTISNFNIVGIASKLLTHFERTYKPTIILTYADVRWSIGNLYNHLGFTLKHMSKPGYWYTKTYNQRIHRFNFQKHLLKEKLSVFDDTLTEWENMKRNGYDRIWDCGNYVFIKENRAESINI